VFSGVILGLIVGSIYFRLCSSCDSGVQNRYASYQYIHVCSAVPNLTAVLLFLSIWQLMVIMVIYLHCTYMAIAFLHSFTWEFLMQQLGIFLHINLFLNQLYTLLLCPQEGCEVL